MPKGLLVDTFRSFDRGRVIDCTNGGLSARHDSFILTGAVVEGPFEPREDTPELVVTEGPGRSLRAVPRCLLDSKTWVMFGGNFVYSSDSRFPSDQPIKIFDRTETAEQSAGLSQ
jgi:hypothetical protein